MLITEHYPSDKYGTDKAAQAARNTRARELRKQGYTGVCQKWDFTDLARCRDYTLEAALGANQEAQGR